jgi:hypothetical protein
MLVPVGGKRNMEKCSGEDLKQKENLRDPVADGKITMMMKALIMMMKTLIMMVSMMTKMKVDILGVCRCYSENSNTDRRQNIYKLCTSIELCTL